jgi:hypothetical protein
MNAHRLAEERSLALHRLIAEVLARDPSQIEKVRSRLRLWREAGTMHRHYADQWARLLDGPFEELRRVMTDAGEHARALRQSTPFAGVIDPRTRWRIWREVRESMSESA